MKRKILSVLAVLVAVLMSTAALAACDKTPAGAESSGGSSDNLSTEQGGESSVSESSAQKENYTFYTQEQLDFWNSDCGKTILSWNNGENYNLFYRKYDNDTVLYLADDGVYVKTPAGEIKEIITQVNVPFDYILVSDNKITVPFDSGNYLYGVGNFPYNFVYDISTGESSIKMRPIGGESSLQHQIFSGGLTDGHFGKAKFDDNSAEIYFDIDFPAQKNESDFYFPQIDYIYDSHTRTAVFYIGCVHCDEAAAALETLEQLEGISNVRYEAFFSADEAVPFGTKLTLSLDDGYFLFGEVFAGYESDSADRFRLWTLKK